MWLTFARKAFPFFDQDTAAREAAAPKKPAEFSIPTVEELTGQPLPRMLLPVFNIHFENHIRHFEAFLQAQGFKRDSNEFSVMHADFMRCQASEFIEDAKNFTGPPKTINTSTPLGGPEGSSMQLRTVSHFDKDDKLIALEAPFLGILRG